MCLYSTIGTYQQYNRNIPSQNDYFIKVPFVHYVYIGWTGTRCWVYKSPNDFPVILGLCTSTSFPYNQCVWKESCCYMHWMKQKLLVTMLTIRGILNAFHIMKKVNLRYTVSLRKCRWTVTPFDKIMQCYVFHSDTVPWPRFLHYRCDFLSLKSVSSSLCITTLK